MTRLAQRLAALEARAPKQPAEEEEKTDYAALRDSLREKFDRILAPDPTGAGGVRYFRSKIAEARHLETVVTPPDDPNGLKTNYIALRKRLMPHAVSESRHDLRKCELDVLAAEGFDAVRLAKWQAEHERFASMPWRWRGADLPADALAVIDSAMVRANAEA